MGSQTFPPTDEPRFSSNLSEHKGGTRPLMMAVVGAVIAVGVVLGWLGYLYGPRLSALANVPSTATSTAAPSPTPIPIEPGSWPTYLGGLSRSAYAASETQLTAQSVANLQLKWTAHGQGAIFSQPVIVNGLVYWGSWDGYEHASYSGTGNLVWSTYVGMTEDAACDPSSVGVASTPAILSTLIDGTPTLVEYVGGGDGSLYALNAETGDIIWQTRLGSSPSHFLWSSPAALDGSVFIGVSSFGDCPLVQGEVVRVDGATGGIQDIFKVVPDGCIGGSVWGSVTIDVAAGALSFGTGNAGDCATDEAYAESVVVLRVSDLSYLGSWRIPPSERELDGDFGSTPTLFTAQIGGQQRSLVGIANKNGLYYAFDEADVSAGPVWETRVADLGSVTITPGGWDGTSLYVLAGETALNGTQCSATIDALNPATGQTAWVYCLTTGFVEGALSLGPGYAIAAGGGTVVVVGTQGDTAGKLLFQFTDAQDSHPWFYGPATIANGSLYVGNSDGNLYAFGL